MPKYKVTNKATGKSYTMTGEQPPNEDQVKRLFDKLSQQRQEPPQTEISPKPNIFQAAGQRIGERAERIFEPTELGGAATKLTGATGKVGEFVEGFAGAPERMGRSVLGAAGTAGEIPGVATELALAGINKLFGGAPGEKIQEIVSKGANSKIGKSVLKNASEKWNNLPDAAKANLGSLPDALDLAGFNVGGAAAKKLIGKAGRKGLKSAVELPNKLAGKFAQELSNTSEEALRMVGTKQGSEAVKKAFGTQAVIGEKILKKLNNYEDIMTDRDGIFDVLQKMPNINTKKTIRVLESAIDKFPIGKGKNANKLISSMIDDIDKQGKTLPANKFFSLRKKIDREIGDSFGKEADVYITALKDTRKQMKEMLVTAAKKSGNIAYAEKMITLAQKMDAVDRLKGYIGKSNKQQAKRIEPFIKNMFGKTEHSKQTLEDISKVFGDDFLEQSKLARIASQLGEGGKPSFLPNIGTGRSRLGVAAFPLGSPFVASKVTLPAMSLTEEAVKSTGRMLGNTRLPIGGAIKAPIRSLQNTPQKKNITADTLKSLKFF